MREAKPSVSASDPCENSHFWPFPRSICMPLPAKPLAVAARNGGFVAAADREHRGADPRENGENADLAPLRVISAANHPLRQIGQFGRVLRSPSRACA
jgi:hypothetical protein